MRSLSSDPYSSTAPSLLFLLLSLTPSPPWAPASVLSQESTANLCLMALKEKGEYDWMQGRTVYGNTADQLRHYQVSSGTCQLQGGGGGRQLGGPMPPLPPPVACT